MSDFDAEFTIMDFLDDRGRMVSPFKDWVLSYLDEVPDGSEDYDAHIVGVTDCSRYCTLRIDSHVKESQHSYTDMDWYYWCARMSGWHGVRVILNREFSAAVLEYHETRIFEYNGEQERQTEIGPEADLTGYVESLEKVSGTLGLDQKRRLEFIIPDCEALRGSLQQKINELKEELASL